jgi:hypothetical protein
LVFIEYRFMGPVASLIAALIHVGSEEVPFSIPVDSSCRAFVDRMKFGRRRGCILMVLICLIVASPPVALSEEIDEGEFSQATLGYKLQLLRDQFEQTETKLSTRSVAGSTLKKLEHVFSEMKRLEAEFRCWKYYPDLLDEQIVIIREKLQLILADPVETTSVSQGENP